MFNCFTTLVKNSTKPFGEVNLSYKLTGVSAVQSFCRSPRGNVTLENDSIRTPMLTKRVETFTIRKNRKLGRFPGDTYGRRSSRTKVVRSTTASWGVTRRRDMTTRVRTAKYSQLSTVCHTPYSAGTSCVCGLLFVWVTRRLYCPQYPYRKTLARFRVCDDSGGFATGPRLGVSARHHEHVPDARLNVRNN